MATKKKVATNELIVRDFHFSTGRVPNCCGARIIHGFWVAGTWNTPTRSWDTLPLEFRKALRAKFVNIGMMLSAITVVGYYKADNKTVTPMPPNDNQAIAGRVLKATGWKLGPLFRGNGGSQLRMWYFDAKAERKKDEAKVKKVPVRKVPVKQLFPGL